MDAKGQVSGEGRVRDHLIDPLKRMGLAKPSSLTVAQFEAMIAELELPPLKWSAPIVRKAEDQVWPLRDPSRKRSS